MQAGLAPRTMSERGPESDEPVRRKATLGQTARAVFWSFFGVRKRAHYEQDAARLNPVHLVLMGIVGAVIFIGVLLAVINWVVLR